MRTLPPTLLSTGTSISAGAELALLGNHTVLAKTPGKTLGGSTVSDARSACNKSGANMGRYAGGFNRNSGTPNGRRPPTAWVWPITSGNMSSYTVAVGEATASGTGKAALKGSGAAAGEATVSATGATVAAMIASAAGSATAAALLIAILLAEGSSSGAATVSGSLSATGAMTGSAAGVASVSAIPAGDGRMSGTSSPFTALSPETLASAVWDALTGDQTQTDTMGFALRVTAAVLRNRVVTDPAAGTYTVYDDDDTVLLVGDLWQDASGTVPYSGSGAERRDRLV